MQNVFRLSNIIMLICLCTCLSPLFAIGKDRQRDINVITIHLKESH